MLISGDALQTGEQENNCCQEQRPGKAKRLSHITIPFLRNATNRSFSKKARALDNPLRPQTAAASREAVSKTVLLVIIKKRTTGAAVGARREIKHLYTLAKA
jgi:hypothetical protein